MSTLSLKSRRANNRNAILAGLFFASGIAAGICTVGLGAAAPVEVADGDAGTPPPDDSSRPSPTLPLPPPVAPIAMADTQ